MRPAADERLAVQRLELVEAAAVDDSRDHLARVHVRAVVVGDQAVEIVRDRAAGGSGVARTHGSSGCAPAVFATMRRAIASACSSLGRVVVGDTGLARVDVGAAELLGGHVLAGRRLHERRAADEDRAGAAHDHGLVAHGRHVGAAGRARAHHDRDLRDPGSRHARLVEEDPAEVLAVREHLRLQRQEGAARVDEVETGQPVLLGDLLRAQVLLHGQREVGAALDRRVVRDDHALPTLDDADPGDDPGARGLSLVHVPGGQRVQLEERRAGVEQPVDPLAGEQLAARAVALDRAARRRRRRSARCASRSSSTSCSIRACRRAKSSVRSTRLSSSATAGA